MATLPFQIYRWVDGSPQAEVGGIVRPISDPQSLAQYGITDFSRLPYHPATGMAGPARGGTTGGAMALQDLINQYNVYNPAPTPTPVIAPATAPNPNAFRPRGTNEDLTSYLQAKQAYEMQTTGASTVNFGQPAPQVAVAQPAPQAQPVVPQAPTPQQPAQPTGKYVQYAGSPDIFDASGRYISAQEAASIPNFQSQVQQIASPRPDIKVESDFAKLAGQNITQMVKEAVAPATPVQQPTTAQPEAPKLPQGAEVTTGSSQKPYVQYEGSPDVFERATGKYISGEEASKIPDFFSQVEKATSVRPGVTTEEDFAKLAKTNLQLQQSGATTTEQDFKTNPLKAFQDTYRQIWDNLGLSNVKKQIEDTLKAKNEVNNEMIDKIAEVNDNPWISEAERSRQITKLTSKYEQKNAANVESLKLLQGVFEMGQQEAQFVTTNALNAFNQQQTFDQQILLKQMDLAEKMATTMEKKSFRDLVGSDGRMHTYIVNDAGEKVADLGISELSKTGGDGIAGGVVSGVVTRDADSIMAGTLNLQDISQKDNYRAGVAAELTRRFNQALSSGDIAGTMKASAVYDKEPSDTFLTSMEKTIAVLSQIGVLQGNIEGQNTGPLVGAFREKNPWDTQAQVIKAQLNAIVPNLARGVYGEVGVLTDNDIKQYAKTLPNLTSTEAIRNAILYITVDQIKKNVEIKIKNQAAGQRDMSGYADVYSDLVNEADDILTKIPTQGGYNVGNIVEKPVGSGQYYKKVEGGWEELLYSPYSQ